MAEPARRRAESRGRWAEALCALALRLKGYRIVARRFRGPIGEIDIIARRGRTLAFIEVKARPSRAAALTALTPHQRRRVERAALAFLARNPKLFAPHAGGLLRFDLMVVEWGRWPRHIRDAWQVDRPAGLG